MRPAFCKRVGDQRNAGPPHAEHLRQELLGQTQGVAAGQIPRPEQPARQPGLDAVRGVAGGGLLGLGQQHCSWRISVVRKSALCSAASCSVATSRIEAVAGDLNDPGVQRHLVDQRGRSADHAVAADHRGLDPLAIGQIDDQRDHAAMRKIDPVDRIAGVKQQVLVHQFERLEMRTKQLEIRRRQRSQQTIGMLNRSHRALRMNKREHGRLSAPRRLEAIRGCGRYFCLIRIRDSQNECPLTHHGALSKKIFSDVFATEPTAVAKSNRGS